MVDEIMQYNQ